MATYIALIGSGLGDVIIALPIIHWLLENAAAGEKLYLVARSLRQLGLDPLIPGLAGTVTEPDLNKVLKPGDTLINLRDHELQTRWDWDSKEFQDKYPDADIYSILSKICADCGLYPDFNKVYKMPSASDKRGTKKILLVPGTTDICKHLEENTWFELLELLQNERLEVAILGEPERSEIVTKLLDRGAEHISTPSPQEAVNVIASSRMLISVDTGLMHIALNQGIRTIAIMLKRSIYFRPNENCKALFAEESVPVTETNSTGFSTVYDRFTWWDGQSRPGATPIKSIKAQQIFDAAMQEIAKPVS